MVDYVFDKLICKQFGVVPWITIRATGGAGYIRIERVCLIAEIALTSLVSKVLQSALARTLFAAPQSLVSSKTIRSGFC